MPTRVWGVLVAVSPRGRTLVVRRPPEGLLGGMWEFPAVEAGSDADVRALVAGRAAAQRGAGRARGAYAGPMRIAGRAGDADARAGPTRIAEPRADTVVELPPVTHRFSHFTAVYRPCRVEVGGEWGEAAGRWVTPSELADMALPAAQLRIARAAGL